MIVYCITNKINSKQYVGVTVQLPLKRWSQHKTTAMNPGKSPQCRLLYNSIRKHGPDNFHFEILATAASTIELGTMEDVFIKKLNTLAPNGYNLRSGGYEGYSYSDESRELNRKAHLGRKHRPESIQKMKGTFAGEKNPFFGKKHPESFKVWISEKNTGQKHTPEQYSKMKAASDKRKGVPRPRHVADAMADRIRKHHMAIPKYFKDPDGFIWSTGNIKTFASTHSLSFRALIKVRGGETVNHRGWTRPAPEEIEDGPIKTEGSARRLSDQEITAIKSENTRRQMANTPIEIRKTNWAKARASITSESIRQGVEKRKKLRELGLYKKQKPHTAIQRERMSISRSGIYYAKSPTGEVVKIERLKLFCDENGFSRSGVHKMLTGKRKKYKKWTKASEEELEGLA